MSIILGLVLLAVVLVVCGPHAYRKLVKKCRCGRPKRPPFQAPLGGAGWAGGHLCFATQPRPAPPLSCP